jgi:Protein of unknown function (DUF1592)/Protein of unknown function (DUF1588)/Protein of unknown function (DUF1587)/Protein of unknown function (DUF1595)/Protein of unknown function (DUF1585)/Ca-dependent carbohydrate-binding module xylan-binding
VKSKRAFGVWLLLLSCGGGALSCAAAPRLDAWIGKPVTPNSAEDPGHPVLHRLNRAEYDNTVHELLGTELEPAQLFPNDDHGFGFDNNAGVLSISPVQFQLYEHAAEILAAEVLAPAPPPASKQVLAGETLTSPFGGRRATAFNLATNGSVFAKFELPAHGKYRVTVRAWGEQSGLEAVRMRVSAAGRELLVTEVPNIASMPHEFTAEAPLSAGATAVEVAFLNDSFDPKTRLDRNLLIGSVSVEGPLDTAAEAQARRAHVLICDPERGGEPCLRHILGNFATRAFRRPIQPSEVDRLLRLVRIATNSGQSAERGLELAVRGVLLSPYFLFRAELDAQPQSPIVRRLSGYELASRLSYFLWSSMPDAELFRAAESGELASTSGLLQQTERLLADKRSLALVDDFAGQWLLLRALDDHQVDSTLSGFDDRTRSDLSQETRLFFAEFLRQPLPVEALLTARFSFLNDNLARYYDLADRPGASFAKVDLSGAERGGLLRQASLLTVTSLPHRSSPVKRGKWVLGQLLCSEPPPPPPGVPQIPHQDFSKATLREILKAHRDKPECAVCHNVLDPIGLSLENYDAIGRFRTSDHGQVVDAHGTLPDGTVLNGPDDLSRSIAKDPRFPACVAEKLYIYALGRGLDPSDRSELDRILKELGGRGFSFSDLIAEVVQSSGFRYRRGEAPNLEASQ